MTPSPPLEVPVSSIPAVVSDEKRCRQPALVFFYSAVSGASRRAEGFLAQVLQRRRNHGTFRLYRVAREQRPDLFDRFEVDTEPTLVVVEGKAVRSRLERPRGCRDIEAFLAPWLK